MRRLGPGGFGAGRLILTQFQLTGPVSATVHVSDTDTHSELLQSLDALYTSSPVMMKYVDIHLVYDPFDRQFNMWRNVAKFFARTEVSLASRRAPIVPV